MTDTLAELSAAGRGDLARRPLAATGCARGNLGRAASASKHVVGVTTNPTIFAEGAQRRRRLRRAARATSPPRGVDVEEAVAHDHHLRRALGAATCCARRTTRTDGVDGRVSIEVDPRLAHETDKTVAEAKALWWLVDRPNLFIKIPATVAGLPAITAALAEGISVNVTLIFSLDRYGEVMDAFLAGLEQAKANGHDLTKIGSVASFFVSRVDTEIDKRLDKIGTDGGQGAARQGRDRQRPARLRARTRRCSPPTAGRRWPTPAPTRSGRCGRRPATKNPDYRDTIYVEELVAPGVVNTMPEATLDAFADHGEIRGDTVTGDVRRRRTQVIDGLAAVGIDYDDVVRRPRGEGVEKFEASLERAARASVAGASWSGRRRGRRGMTRAVERRRTARRRVRRGRSRAGADGGPLATEPSRRRAGRLAAKDPTLWGPEAEAGGEDPARLGRHLPAQPRSCCPSSPSCASELRRGLDHVVLAGMGGSSLAPEVITRTLGAAADRARHHRPAPGPARRWPTGWTAPSWWSSSKSGGTVETDSHRRAYWQAFRDAGLTEAEAGRHFVVVTDPGSPLETTAREMGAHRGARRPRRRRPLLRADRVRPGALGARRRRRAELLDQAEELRRRARRRRRQPGARARRGARRRRDRRPGQGRAGRRRHRHRRPRRLGRAADRRVDRQAGHGHPAGRGRGARRARRRRRRTC